MAGKLFSEDEFKAAVAEAVAQATASATASQTDAVKAAAKAEGERIRGIYALAEFKGRETLGQLLVDKGMSVDDAKIFLAAAPVEKSAVEANVDKTAQQKALELLAAETPKVEPDKAAVAVAAAAQAAKNGINMEAVAAAKSFAAAKYGRK